MALILLCEEDPTGSAVTFVGNDRICDMILQLYHFAWCQIIPLTKNETQPKTEQCQPEMEQRIKAPWTIHPKSEKIVRKSQRKIFVTKVHKLSKFCHFCEQYAMLLYIYIIFKQ